MSNKSSQSKTIHRLMAFIKSCGLSARQFDLSIGASNGYTLRMAKNNASIGSDVLETIFKIYPQLNIVWLLTGEGNMINENIKEIEPAHKSSRNRALESIIEKKIIEYHEKQKNS